MKILHVIQRYWPYTGGSERHLQEIAERQARAGHDVTVATTDAFDLELFWRYRARRVRCRAEIHNGVRIVRFPVHHLPYPQLTFPGIRHLAYRLSQLPLQTDSTALTLAKLAPVVPGLYRYLRNPGEQFDIVHGMNICFEGMLAAARDLARAQGIPFVITPLTHLGESDQDAVGRYYTMRHQITLEATADAVMAQTRLEIDYLIRRGVPADKIQLAGVGVNPESVAGGDGARFREERMIDSLIVFYVGTAAYDKGTVHLVEAMRRLWADGSAATLVLAGPSLHGFRAYLDTLSEAERKRIRVLGFIEEREKRDLFAAGDVFVMPSRTDSFGIVYLEAWLNGKPVVGADAGGVPEVISDGKDGYLVKFGDVESLASRVQLLLDDPGLRDQLGAAGRQKTMANYTWNAILPRIEEVYGRLWKISSQHA